MITTKKNLFKFAILSPALLLASCAQNHSASVGQAAQSVAQAVGCVDMKNMVFNSFYNMIDQSQTVPLASDMKSNLQAELNKLKTEKNMTADQAATLDQITNELFTVVDLMLEQTPDMTAASWKEQIQKIIEFEMGDQSSPKIINSTQKIEQALSRVKTLAAQAEVGCNMTYSSTAQGASGGDKASSSYVGVAQGVNRVLATAYQSCRVLDLPAMDASTPSVVGITRLAQGHPDGVGGRRVISDLKSVQNTHYYIRNIATESSCIQVRDNPPIYDYGGTPAVSGTTLNFFKDAGSGTTALGVDCSAFVSSAIGVAGLRYKPGLDNKPIYTRQTSSKFMSASKSGFTCFDNVTVTPTQSIAAGDIVGINGHVVVVERVGADPFGLKAMKSDADCAGVNYKNFDIDIAQSSPSKGAIGMNKYKASVYLAETSGMRTAFVEMGQQACHAKFTNKSIKPNSSAWGFIRHKGTPECLAPRVSLTGESCAQSCF